MKVYFLVGCRWLIFLFLFCSVLSGCKSQNEKQDDFDHTTTRQATGKPDKKQTEQGKPSLPWIKDDFNKAKRLAEKEEKPLVIDMWAEWCHTCLSMKNYVLNDPSLLALANRFIWLEVDTEKARNAALIVKYPLSVWPTFLVMGGNDFNVQARHIGATSASGFREFLLAGEIGHLDSLKQDGKIDSDDPLYYVRNGDRLALDEKHLQAKEAYITALKKAPANWKRRSELLLLTLVSLYKTNDWEKCVDFGLLYAKQVGHKACTADFLSIARACSKSLNEEDPRRTTLAKNAIAILKDLHDDEKATLSADDRSELLRVLREFYEDIKDKKNAKRIANVQLGLLDIAAKEAPNPEASATYNWPRAEVYVYLKRGMEIVRDLKQSAKKLPKFYDPPYRLAWVFYKLDEHGQAIEAARKALDLTYGSRKARIYELMVDIYLARNDIGAAIVACEEILAIYNKKAGGRKNSQVVLKIKQTLAELRKMQKKQ